MASISPQILPQVLGLDQANRAWNNLEKRVLDEEELAYYTLNGLPPELNSFKTTIRTRPESIKFEELISLMNAEDMHMTKDLSSNPITVDSTNALVSPVTTDNASAFGGSNKVACQICNRTNHTAVNCYHRLNLNYQPRVQGSSRNSQFRGQQQFNHPNIGAQNPVVNQHQFYPQHGMPGKSVSFPMYQPQRASFSLQKATSSFYTISCVLFTQQLVFDSGASSHITHDLSNLSIQQPYTGTDGVLVGNGSELPIAHSGFVTHAPFELMHMDVWGPAPVASFQGFRYYLLIMDDFTRFVWLFPLHYKSDVKVTISNFKAFVSTQFQCNIKSFRSDNGDEFVNTYLAHLCTQFGILHQTSWPHTPKQNGAAATKT
ncbi:hypothetical protein Acr_17g0011230 [Actinidia rufa]|uniref:Integrase catalytic domain-containing protein n=1 Tax=Actinidia rufa TaxID=165716 RepID=A0A7J0G432_9ERIC|nr:hypothetical protein Acr_17g0011230 [Actinidia rufa]